VSNFVATLMCKRSIASSYYRVLSEVVDTLQKCEIVWFSVITAALFGA